MINYGETVKILNHNRKSDKAGIIWLKVYSLRGNAGYIPENDLAKSQIYKQINSILGNNHARTHTPVKYKRALRKYFVDNQLIHNNYSKWKLYAEPKKDFENNMIAEGDFNGNEINDFACIIKNSETGDNKLLIFFDNLKEIITIEYDSPIKIKQIENGKKGGRWYIGNNIKRISKEGKKYETHKYEYLTNDGLLIFKSDSQENILYLYNIEEKMLNTFSQTK